MKRGLEVEDHSGALRPYQGDAELLKLALSDTDTWKRTRREVLTSKEDRRETLNSLFIFLIAPRMDRQLCGRSPQALSASDRRPL